MGSSQGYRGDGRLLLAFTVGVVHLRVLTNAALALFQFSHTNRSSFALINLIVLAATVVALNLAPAVRIASDDTARRLFCGLPNERDLVRAAGRANAIHRAYRWLAATAALPWLAIIAAEATSNPMSPNACVALVAAVALLAIVVAVLAATHRLVEYLSQRYRFAPIPPWGPILGTAILIVAGPDFRVVDGTVTPHIVGSPGAPLPPLAAALVAVVVLLLSAASVFASVDRDRAPAGSRSPARAHPIRRLYRKTFGVTYWLAVSVVLLAVSGRATSPLALVGLAAAFGLVTYATHIAHTSRRVQTLWHLPQEQPLQFRALAPFGVLHLALHVALASALALIRVLGPSGGV